MEEQISHTPGNLPPDARQGAPASPVSPVRPAIGAVDTRLLREELTDAQSQIAALRALSAARTIQDPHPELRVPGSIRTTFRRGGGTAATPVAWTVRAFAAEDAEGNPTTVWRIWSPDWTLGRALRRPSGMGAGWNDLPAGVTSGTLHAALAWTGTATKDADGAVSVTWTPGDPILTNNPAEIPADAEPVPADPETSSAGSTGHRSVIVAIGDFIPATTQGGTPTFEQRHVGAIVENMVAASAGGGGQGLPDGLTIPGWVSLEPITRMMQGTASSTVEVLAGYALMQTRLKWDAAQSKFVEDGTFKQGEIGLDTFYIAGAPKLINATSDPTERALLRKIEFRQNGSVVGTDTILLAWERDATTHASDHTEGVL